MKKKTSALMVAAGMTMLLLCGCSKKTESYSSSEEAKQAMNACASLVVEGNVDSVNQTGNILADGKIAGKLKETGILNTKWTISVDGETWFYVKFVTDEPINDIDGVLSGTTYGYYDSNDQCLGYAQKRIVENENLERDYYLVFLDADGNPKDYLAEEEGRELYDYDGNQIGSARAEKDGFLGSSCYTEIDVDSDIAVDCMDKIAMYIPVLDELTDIYRD